MAILMPAQFNEFVARDDFPVQCDGKLGYGVMKALGGINNMKDDKLTLSGQVFNLNEIPTVVEPFSSKILHIKI